MKRLDDRLKELKDKLIKAERHYESFNMNSKEEFENQNQLLKVGAYNNMIMLVGKIQLLEELIEERMSL